MLTKVVFEYGSENWRVVAVTLEKKVAIVVIFTYRVVALSFSSARNVGRAEEAALALAPFYTSYLHLSPNNFNSFPASFISLSRFVNSSSQM